MKLLMLILLLGTGLVGCTAPSQIQTATKETITDFTKEMKSYEGYFDFFWDGKQGKIWLKISNLDQEFLYIPGLAAGVGSNDIGLDRGLLGSEKIVKFVRSGPKILMVQVNYGFRAESNNPAEQKSVREAFAQSVIGGFTIHMEEDGQLLVDATDFILRDASQVALRLKQRGQGVYSLDTSKSALYLDRTKSFPQNTEFEAILTFVLGDKETIAPWTKSVTPSGESITVRQHHSFVALPDDSYERRPLDPRSGFFGISYQDYATPIDQPLVKRFIQRHRLLKKDPQAAVSEAVEPIVYYVDAGAPEPILSALIEGASWWNQAFEAIGYRDAFQVKVLPEDADPLDVRYNVIQWVHRSTRGWSYGNTVSDPRTGEIIKGHVSLGSLRVRQDFLIAQGLVEAYREGQPVNQDLLSMALARLRQLSAHEVGHTLGLNHNFAASSDQRASVMDYPHPLITLKEGKVDFSQAYDQKIGAWDIRTVMYGYQDFPQGTDVKAELQQIIKGNIAAGLHYITDRDSRPHGSAHPQAHLWDNHDDAIEELERLLKLRDHALSRFGAANIPIGASWSTLEEVLVPVYLMHRYQSEAVIKSIGGVYYNYAHRGDNQEIWKPVSAEDQQRAMNLVLKTLKPEFLAIPQHVRSLLPPKPPAHHRGRESFQTRTGVTFDPMAAAESLAGTNLDILLNGQRATRLADQASYGETLPGLQEVLAALIQDTWKKEYGDPYHQSISRMVSQLCLERMLQLAVDESASVQARAITSQELSSLRSWISNAHLKAKNRSQKAHYAYALDRLKQWREHPGSIDKPKAITMPDGSPIGSTLCDFVH